MGIIVSGDFIAVGNTEITARAEVSAYPKVNIMDNWHLKRRFRADDLVKSDSNPILRLDLGSAQTVAGVMLNDVNFDKTRIRGHATDLGTNWAASTYDSGSDHAVTLDSIVNRYKIYIPLTAFNYRWLAIMTPAAAGAVGSYTTKWEIGTLIILDSAPELSVNMAYGYEVSASKASQENEMPSGGLEKIALSDNLRWTGKAVFENRSQSDESEMWTLNRIDNASPVVFYENGGDDEKCYLAVRDDDYRSTLVNYGIVKGNGIQFKELV